ncbi:MAG TPA: penicillin-binding protein activator [Kofleriaceae bacterium]|nr:penicillin-binding protein activator [Kofleriaceae bacterium]
MRAALVLATLCACGAKPPPASWVEHESHGSEIHATHENTAVLVPGEGIAIADPSKLDPAAIDGLDEATATATLTRIGDAAPAARLALRAARLAWHRGDPAQARALIARATSAADEPAVRGELSELAKAVAAPKLDPKLVAVLLPLSGRYASIGSELKLAVQLAPAQGTTWLFLDTKGEPDGAAAAVKQAYDRGAIAILGPVGTREAVAAAREAALRGIPIALLAPSDGADPAAGVFRVVGSPGDEARAVAQLAVDESFPTVAVLSPRDDVGQETADAFVAEAKRLGLQVTAQGTYDPTGGNLEPDLKAFLNLVPAKNPRLAEHLARHGKKGWATFSPDINYSLLYIPDRYDRAALVAAFLPYYGVELRTSEFPDPAKLTRKHGGVMPQVVQLVGGAGWHHPSLAIRGGAPLQGALVIDAFAGDQATDTGVAFAQSFQQRTKRSPSTAAAETFDAATLVARARREASASSEFRAAMRAALAHGKLDDGACGPAQIGADGELVRELAVLELQGDQLQLVP